jgi:hypothetical protein
MSYFSITSATSVTACEHQTLTLRHLSLCLLLQDDAAMEEFNAMDIDGILAKRARVITTGDVDPKVLLLLLHHWSTHANYLIPSVILD